MFVEYEGLQMDYEEARLLFAEAVEEKMLAIQQAKDRLNRGEDPTRVFLTSGLEKIAKGIDDPAREAQEAIIELAWSAYFKELKQKQPKYARIARMFVPALRHIYWHGQMREEAQDILQVLSLEQTQPLTSLDASYGDVEGVYQDVDSYTGESLDKEPEPLPRELQLGQDLREVVAEMIAQEGDIDGYTGEFIVSKQQEAEMLGDRKAPLVPDNSDSLTLRLIEEYRELGYSEDDIAKIVQATSGDYVDEEDEWFDDRGITSVPIQQNNEQELNIDYEQLAYIRERAGELPYELRNLARKVKNRLYFVPLEHLAINIEQEVAVSHTANAIVEFATEIAEEVDVQNLFVFMASLVWLDSRFKDVNVPLYGTLADFADTFGDDVLDQVADAAWNPTPTTQDEIEEIAQQWEREIIEHQFEDEADNIEHTKAYARGVFGAIALGNADLKDAGYRQWRWEKSKSGSIAYDYAMEKHADLPWIERTKKAWRAFYHAGKIVSILKNGLRILEEATGKEQVVNWNIAKWKLENKEIHLTKEDRARLKKILHEKRIGGVLARSL